MYNINMVEYLIGLILELQKEITALHKLLDLRDEEYFEFCETGKP